MTPEPPARRRLRKLGETCLWLIVIGIAVIGAVDLLSRITLVVLPVLLAIVLATFLHPPASWLKEMGISDGIAAVIVVVVGLAVIAATFAFLVPPVVQQFGDFNIGIAGVVNRVEEWVRASPLPISTEQIGDAINRFQTRLSESVGAIASRLVSGAALALELLAGLLLAIVLLFFLLKDGTRIWAWFVSLAPPSRRDDVDQMGRRSWTALGGFVRGQFIVAIFDAVLIGLALVLIGVPLALPLAVLTFFGAFIPVIGATVTGLLAVLVALVAVGPVAALLTLAAIVAVQQLEGNVLQPVVVGRAIQVHPIAILLGVTAGAVLAGIIGAMIASPLVAVGAAILGYLREHSEDARTPQGAEA